MSTSLTNSSSSALWAYLRRKDTSSRQSENASSSADTPQAPIAPIDKTGTSMRILLSDTHANLEIFGQRVGKLTALVEDSKRTMDVVGRMWKGDREKLSEEMIDTVDRCQNSLLSCMNTQAKTLDDLCREATSLGKRIDDLHALHQTQSHAIQAQSHAIQTLTQIVQTQLQALQTLQDRQGTVLSAVVPLSSLLQNILLQIESSVAKTWLGVQQGSTCATDMAMEDVGRSPFRRALAAKSPNISGATADRLHGLRSDFSPERPFPTERLSLLGNRRARSPEPHVGIPSGVTILPAKKRKRFARGPNVNVNAVTIPPGLPPTSPSQSPCKATDSLGQQNVRISKPPLSPVLLTPASLDDPSAMTAQGSVSISPVLEASRHPPQSRTPDRVLTPTLFSCTKLTAEASPPVPSVLTAPVPIVNVSQFWKAGKRFIPLDDDSADDNA